MKTITQRNRNGQGFSLIEVIVTLMLVAMLVLMLGSSRWLRASVAAEAEVLRACLRYAEALAMANNTATWGVEITENEYMIRRNGGLSPFPLPGTDSSTHTLPAGVRVTSGAGIISFNQWGAPASNRVIVLSNGGETRSVMIHGFTGLVP
jgi:prepilin-type N-terminal cleavage/methylation domain-containing protein